MQTTQTVLISPAKRRTAIYARVSTADQKNGLEAQIRALRVFCEQNKIDDYELFMAVADHTGHDKRGNRTYVRDEYGAEVEVEAIETVRGF